MTAPKPLQIYLEALGPLCRACHGADSDTVIRGATADSRQVRPGWIFCAIRGAREDGGRYIPAAVRAGAVAVVCEQAVAVPPGTALLEVRNSYAAAARVAETAWEHPARSLRILGVTGTNGKTTCAFLLHDMLRRSGARAGMIGTVSYRIDTLDTAAARTTPPPFQYQQLLHRMLGAGIDTVVLEASSHALVQRRPGTDRFQGALFTNLTRDHLDYHGTMENYYQAKRILFTEYLGSGAPAVIFRDSSAGRRLLRELRDNPAGPQSIGVGTSSESDVRIHACRLSPTGSTLQLRSAAGNQALHTPLIGRFNVVNVALAASLAHASGLEWSVIEAAIRDAKGAPGRLEPVHADNGVVAFVDYAHTPDALRQVLRALRHLRPQRLLVVFGCGGDRDRGKRPRMGRAAARLADVVILTSDNPRSEDRNAILADIRRGIPTGTDCRCEPDRARAIAAAVTASEPGDIMLIAGKGHESTQEIGSEKIPFEDIAEVRRAMRARGILGD